VASVSDRGWVRLLGRSGLPAVVVAGMSVASPAAAATWRIQGTPNPPGTMASVLGSVSCPSARACTAVGGFFGGTGSGQQTEALAERWDGRHWALQSTPNPSGIQASWLSSVWCPSATACAAVGYIIDSAGYVTLAERWDGRSWAIQRTPNPVGAQTSLLSGVSCVSARVCTAVGDFTDSAGHTHALAERWNGRSWAIQATQDPGYDDELGGVSCTSASACTAVGSYYNRGGEQVTLAERWNRSSWTVQSTPNPPARPPLVGNAPTLNTVSCPSVTTCTAIGSYYRGSGDVMLAERWNGDRWAIQRTPNPATVNYPGGVSCTSANMCTAVAMGYTDHYFTYAERWDGTSWTLQRTPNPAAATDSGLYDVSCTAPSTCTAVGNFINRAGAHLTLAERYSNTTMMRRARS
jgi:hypothetical protein